MVKQIKYSFQYFLLALLAFFLLSGCSMTSNALYSTESITSYAESLFKRQNLLTQELMFLSEEDMTLADEEIIYQAETEMHDACHLLNEYVNRKMEEKSMSFFFHRRVKNSLKACEERVINMESVLMEINEEMD